MGIIKSKIHIQNIGFRKLLDPAAFAISGKLAGQQNASQFSLGRNRDDLKEGHELLKWRINYSLLLKGM